MTWRSGLICRYAHWRGNLFNGSSLYGKAFAQFRPDFMSINLWVHKQMSLKHRAYRIVAAILILGIAGRLLYRESPKASTQSCLAPIDGYKPTVIAGLSSVASIGPLGMGWALFAVSKDGSVWTWRATRYCQQAAATKIIPDKHVAFARAVASGSVHQIVLAEDGHVWGIVPNGYNMFRQLGTDQTGEREIPVLHDIKAIAAGADHSLALQTNGAVWAWGSNDCGQSAGELSPSGTSPVRRVQHLDDVIAIGAGFRHSLALKRNGTVWQWGNLSSAEFEGNVINQPVYGYRYCAAYNQPDDFQALSRPQPDPEQVRGLPRIRSIATYYTHNLALGNDGTVWGWGVSDCGQAGPIDQSLSNASAPINDPARIAGLDHVIAIAVGRRHSLALKSDGSVWVWGDNENGQLAAKPNLMTFGDRCLEKVQAPLKAPHSMTPIQVKGLPLIKAIAAGKYLSAALDEKGRVWYW